MSAALVGSVVRAAALGLVVIAPATALCQDNPPDEETPRGVGPSVEQFLLDMREQFRADDDPSPGPPAEGLGAEAFRGALQRAAGEIPPAAPAGGPAYPAPVAARAQPQPPAWVTLLDAARRLEQVAHELDRAQLWDAGVGVRAAAQDLRQQARHRCESGVTGPLSPAEAD